MKDFGKSLVKSQKLWILAGVVLVMTILQPGIFLTRSNIVNTLYSISIYGIMVCGAIFTILLGGIDLAVGAVAAAAGAATVKLITAFGVNTFLAVLVGLLLGLGVGLVHGIMVAQFGVPAFLVTLATQNIVYGIAQLITKNKVTAIMGPPSFIFLGSGQIFGIPFPIYILLITGVLSYIILNHTVFGRQIYSVGGNVEASLLSGIRSKRVIMIAYTISGLTAALAGIALASMNRQAIAKAASGYETEVITAIVVGGTSLMGGEGNIQGAIWGVLLVGIISNALRLMGITSNYHGIVKGIVIIGAVALDAYVRFSKSGLRKGGHKKAKKEAAKEKAA
ncbi:MAG: ABC transporter permease [Lachnospiraceae bacterium]|nr:ABC transporter permease [Lachnospiraceae bacterium]